MHDISIFDDRPEYFPGGDAELGSSALVVSDDHETAVMAFFDSGHGKRPDRVICQFMIIVPAANLRPIVLVQRGFDHPVLELLRPQRAVCHHNSPPLKS
jgi:hypothetical protein